MIPSDVAARLQLPVDAAVARAPTAQQVSSALADLSPGQRVLAEIQALLPTGAYRALINQRDITLALPFSAKAGDTLELEVVESEGRLTLAVVARKEVADTTPHGERPAVETTLSRTGNFIAGLLSRSEEGQASKPTPLNANQPIAATPPATGSDLVPLLKQALSRSGMFYESHQAQWVSNRLPIETLLSEPQGMLSMPHGTTMGAETARVLATDPETLASAVATPPLPRDEPNHTVRPDVPQPKQTIIQTVEKPLTEQPSISGAATADASRVTGVTTPAGQLVAPDLLPLVQQQLEALANQTYVWQGQVWPGQQMTWEIEEGGHRNADGNADDSTQWQTRLTLTMPQLGEVRAALRLRGGDLSLLLSADNSDAASRLASGGDLLRTQFESAGLKLAGLSIVRHENAEG